MAHFLLVHGSSHGAWCWRDLTPALEAQGHSVAHLDLPGSGADTTPLKEVTLEAYATAILSRIDQPTVLLGHSAGGYAITQAAERDPHNIARLIYLCAYVPAPGMSLAEMRFEAREQPLKGALEMSPDGIAFRFKDHALRQNLYQDCTAEVVDYARKRLSWQAVAPQITPVSFTGLSAGVAKSYVVCTQDQTIPPAHQRKMAAGFAPTDLYEIATGHSPFFADPEGLARQLGRIVAD